MKKYTTRATNWLPKLILVSIIILAIGIILIIVDSPNVSLQVGFTMFGGLVSVIFLAGFFAEKSRTLIIDADKIIFPRGIDKNGKTVFKKTVIKFAEIKSVQSEFYKGDKIISGDCFFYILKLKDGTKVTVTLYHYGKEAEKEILERMQRNIV